MKLSRLVALAIVLGFTLSFAYSAAAQTVTANKKGGTTTVPQSSTCIAGFQDGWFGGWALCTSRPNEPVTVVLVMDSQRDIAQLSANLYRSDVGDHAFNTTDDSQVCNGIQHTISAYALDPEKDQYVLLAPSSPEANQALCGEPAAAISGTMKNQSGKAIKSSGWNQSFMALLKLNERRIAQQFGSASIDDEGRFSIQQGFGGQDLVDGDYQLWAIGRGYLNDANSHVSFTYSRANGFTYDFVLNKVPVYIELTGEVPVIPSNGEFMWLPLRVCNLDFYGSALHGMNVEVNYTVAGLSQTSLYNVSQPRASTLPVPPAVGTCLPHAFPVVVDADSTDGFYVCSEMKTHADGNPDAGWSQVGGCAPKGATEDLGAVRPNSKKK